jgi:gamma-glutamyltranspeptidase/glutathione hydrolase
MHGAIASEHSTASQIGAAILAAGGNAVDAAIATTLAVGTLNPYHSCIGGGGFAIVLPESGGQVESIDFRVTAPVRGEQPGRSQRRAARSE